MDNKKLKSTRIKKEEVLRVCNNMVNTSSIIRIYITYGNAL